MGLTNAQLLDGRLESTSVRSLARPAACVFGAFVSLFLLTAAPRMLAFADSGSILNAANGLFDHGPGPADKWGLGQVLLDLLVVKPNRAIQSTAPEFQIFYALIVAVLPAAIGAMVPLFVFLIASQLRYRLETALFAAFSVGLGTLTWVYSQTLFSEPAIAASWLLAIYGLIAFAQTRRRRWLVLTGTAAGFALLTKNTALLVLPFFGLYCALTLREQLTIVSLKDCLRHARTIATALLALIAPIVVSLGVSLWYNHARYGRVFETGYNLERDGTFGFNTSIMVGLFGLVASSGKGFFFYSPIAALGLAGAGFFRAHKNEAMLLWAMIAVTIAAHMKWWAWHGDWCWGPRFLVPLTPLFALLSLGAIESIRQTAPTWLRTLKMLAVGALLVGSICVQVLGLCFEPAPFIRLVSAEIHVLGGGFYDAGRWPIRDDGLIPHFIPEFSPLAGHAWMLRVARAAGPKTKSALLADPPWATLNPRWVTSSTTNFNPDIQLWWVEAQHGNHPHRVLLRRLAWLLFLMFLASTAWLIRESRNELLDRRAA